MTHPSLDRSRVDSAGQPQTSRGVVVALSTGIATNWSTIKSMFGSWVIVIALVVAVVAGALGLVLGLVMAAKSTEVRTTTGLVSIFRFGSLGLIIIGAQLNGDPDYLGPAITFALVDFILPLALAVEIGRRAGAGAPKVTPTG